MKHRTSINDVAQKSVTNKRNHRLEYLLALGGACMLWMPALAHAENCSGAKLPQNLESDYTQYAGGERGPLGCLTEAPSSYNLAEGGKSPGTRAVFLHGEIALSPSLSPFGGPFIGYVDDKGLHVRFDSYMNAPAYEIGVGQWGAQEHYEYKVVKTPGASAVSGVADFPLGVIGDKDAFVRLVRCPKSGNSYTCNPVAAEQVAEIHVTRSMIPTAPVAASTAKASAPAAAPPRKYSIDIEQLQAATIRSGHSELVSTSKDGNRDSLYSYLTVKVGNGKVLSAPVWGRADIPNGGSRQVNQSIQNIEVNDDDVVKIAYSVINNGHNSPGSASSAVEKDLATVVNNVVDADVKKISDYAGVDLSSLSPNEKNALVGSQLATALGASEVGVIGGGLVGFFAAVGWNSVFPDCDGPVAGKVYVTTGAQLRATIPNEKFRTFNDDNPGVDSGHGCGANSDYKVTWHIHALD